ncbi:MAG: hypothetical protein PVJ71_04570 [Lysobacterales bacterium]|jgi:hypothetical protein
MDNTQIKRLSCFSATWFASLKRHQVTIGGMAFSLVHGLFSQQVGEYRFDTRRFATLSTGFLFWPLLINVMDILSPFWAMLVLKDGSRSAELLTLLQPYVP